MRRTAAIVDAHGLADGDLLARFVATRDQEAFAILVSRHGGIVLDVCRSVLGNDADAEDAFQASFLVLARNAAKVRKGGSLAAWLYGVASRTARKARGRIARRRTKEAAVSPPPPIDPDDLSWRDVRRVVHEALAALAEQYRSPLVLCYLQGLNQDDAAAALGLSRPALKKRLERGREQLRTELMRRGLGPTALLAALAVPVIAAPPALAAATVELAVLFASGHTAAIPASIIKLSEGGHAMLSGKFITALCLFPALVAGGVLAGASGQPPTRADVPTPTAAAADAPAQDKKAKSANSAPATDPDLAQIGKEWKVKHIETNGQGLLTEEQLKSSRMSFKDDSLEVKGFDILGSSKVAFKIDSTKTPKEIDIKLLEGPQKGESFQGIYLVRKSPKGKEEMRIALRLEGTQFGRPKGYVTNSGTTIYTFILERGEDKEAVPTIGPKPVAPTAPEKGKPQKLSDRLGVGMNDSLDGGSIVSAEEQNGKRVLHGVQVKFGPGKRMLEYAVYNRGALESRTQFYPNGKTFRHERREHNGDGHVVVYTPDDSNLVAEKVVVDGGVDIGPIKTQDTICLCMVKADKPWDGKLLAWEPIPNGYGRRLMMQEYRNGEKLRSMPFAIEKLGLPEDQRDGWQWPWTAFSPAP
jgi:RNA polymerase sigma factor (sigma-70 family)